jgi:hypothetical protein
MPFQEEGLGYYEDVITIAESSPGPGRVLEVSARPLSAAEAALVKAAEALRRKAVMETAQAGPVKPCQAEEKEEALAEPEFPFPLPASGMFRGSELVASDTSAPENTVLQMNTGSQRETMNKDNKMNKTNQVNKVQVNPADKEGIVEKEDIVCGEDIREADPFKSVGGVDRDRTENTVINLDQHKDTDQTEGMRPAERSAERTADKAGNKDRDWDSVPEHDRPERGTSERDTSERGTFERHTPEPSAARKSLAAAEIIYPKEFNLFDRRQMQYLLGKRLSRAVRLENGDVMREGEYITAEMLSLVRTRATLMELTAHIRKS